jgi:hypothetical protein
VIGVSHTLTVEAPIERAFAVFTAGFASWWPRSHHIGEPAAVVGVGLAGQPCGGLCRAAGRVRIDGPDRLKAPVAVPRPPGLDGAGLLPGQQARGLLGDLSDAQSICHRRCGHRDSYGRHHHPGAHRPTPHRRG